MLKDNNPLPHPAHTAAAHIGKAAEIIETLGDLEQARNLRKKILEVERLAIAGGA